ncbi:MAG: SbcC/MukB-like Walker B domain-containing protein [Chromatiales bacterium]|jgi:hypothetical protein
MFLKRFVFVNWGNIPSLEFEFGPVNLFSGGNGSGKTSAADAIQTVMTAAHENLFQYNPGQDETTQRGRGGKRMRTLASYVLGCDDGSYARLDPSDGYLAAVFHPTTGETAEPFTAVICARAWLDRGGSNQVARQDELQFLILPGEQLNLGHFVRGETDPYVVPLDKLQTLLITEFGQRAVEKYDTKKGYLRRLYGALRGRSDAVTEQEAVAAARAFSRFMAYKPVQGINRFVAEEILERRDLGEAIRSVSSQLKTIHAMERDAGNLVESIGILGQARIQSQLYIEQWIELNLLDYTLAQAEYLQRQQEYNQAKQRQREQQRSLADTEGDIEQVRLRRASVHDQLVSLEAQRLGVDALKQKDQLEQARQRQERQLVEQGKSLLGQDNQLQQNLTESRLIDGLLPEIPELAELEASALGKKVLRQGRLGELDLHALLQKDLTGDLAALESHLGEARELQSLHNAWVDHWREAGQAGDGQSRRDRLYRLGHEQNRQYEQLAGQRKQKVHEIERLQAARVSYPPYVERALEAIRKVCPEADPRVLCDHVEVKDPRWQAAIEGYLGGARFSILVEEAYEAEAIRILRRLPGRDNRARIIQGARAARDAARNGTLHKDSIVHVLEFSHAVARHYLTAGYGSVLRVDSAETLRLTRRGLTEDGMASGNYSMWRCDLPDAELVFGAAARERALRAKQEELAQLEADWQQANDRMQRSASLLKSVDRLQTLDYADLLGGMLQTHRELQRLEGLLAQLDLGEHEALERRLGELKQQEAQLQEREAELNRAVGDLNRQLADSDKMVRGLSEHQEENRERVEQREQNLKTIAATWPEFDSDTRLNQADREARELKPQIAEYERDEITKQLHGSERKMNEALQSHNQHCRPGDAIVYTGFAGDYDNNLFRNVCGLQREIDRVYNILKNNILVEKHEQLRQLKGSFNNAFVSHLCHAIHQSINDGKRQIELLNKELQHHRFGSDQETFRFGSSWIPEYRDYARFFEEVVRNPQLGEETTLFEAELSERSRRVLESLMNMLLDENEQRAFLELERIADYRNYRRYEIYKEVEGKPPIPLSEYGTGSGGQLETPAYIIRSAAITSAFRFAEGANHLRMVLVDEAFSKMDETRSREVIGYLTKSLGLQLIFIMPTSKCGPFMDLISNEFVFAKCPSEQPRGELNSRVLVDRKQLNRDRIQALWADHRRTIYHQAELDFMEEVLN